MDKKLQDLAWSVLPKEFKEEVKNHYRQLMSVLDWFQSKTSLNNEECDRCDLIREKIAVYNKLFGYHNLTSDAEGEEMLIVSRRKVQELYNDHLNKGAIEYSAFEDLFGSKCLPDENSSNFERLEKNDEPKPAKPKFKVGDKIRIVKGGVFYDRIGEVTDIDFAGHLAYYKTDRSYEWLKESDLEPCTEPDTSHETPVFENHSDNTSQKEVNVNSNRNLSQDTANCDKQFDNILKDTHQNESLFGKKLDYTMTGRLLGVENLRLKIAAMDMQGILNNGDWGDYRGGNDQEVRIAKASFGFADALIAESELPMQPFSCTNNSDNGID